MASRKTSLFSAHEKLKKVRTKRTGYRRGLQKAEQKRSNISMKAEQERAFTGEVIGGLQSISTMAEEWKQQREMDTTMHKAFSELEGVDVEEREGKWARFTKGKYKYSRGGEELTGTEQLEALSQSFSNEGKYTTKAMDKPAPSPEKVEAEAQTEEVEEINRATTAAKAEAKTYGEKGYAGTESQNDELMKHRGYEGTSIVDALKKQGEDSSIEARGSLWDSYIDEMDEVGSYTNMGYEKHLKPDYEDWNVDRYNPHS